MKPPLDFSPDDEDAIARMVEEEAFGIQPMSSDEGLLAMEQRLEFIKREILIACDTYEENGSPSALDAINEYKHQLQVTEARIKEYKLQQEGKN